MSRILVGLASVNVLLLLITFAIGLGTDGRASLAPEMPLTSGHEAFTYHLIGGLSATLFTLLLHSLIFTYFIGTGRWVREVVRAYRFSDSLWQQSRNLKSRIFPFILGSMLLVIATAVLGAAADRGFVDPTVHLALAMLTIGFNLWSYIREYLAVRANSELISNLMSEVSLMRRERGLE